MDGISNDDIKTTQKILLAEVILVIAFMGVSAIFPKISFIIIFFLLINIIWSVRLLVKRPPGYAGLAFTVLIFPPMLGSLSIFIARLFAGIAY